MAGGSGTRLYPVSRENNPKQLHSLIGAQSLMTQTIERIAPLIAPENVWVVTSEKYLEQIAAHCTGVPRAQIIAEPFALGTNLAVGLGAIHLAQKEPDAIMLIGWSDAHIGKSAEFRVALENAARMAETVAGVILSIKPTFASTAYGYIETGASIGDETEFYEIARFEEKPAAMRAAEFYRSGRHFWNSGISVWKVSSLLELFERHAPEHFEALQRVAESIGTENFAARVTEALADLPKTAIDNAIFERADGLVTMPVDIEWNDIGSWSAIYEVQAKDGTGNVTRGQVVSLDTENCLIYADKRLITTLGVSDLVIVETADAILVANKNDAERLKELHAQVKKFDAAYL